MANKTLKTLTITAPFLAALLFTFIANASSDLPCSPNYNLECTVNKLEEFFEQLDINADENKRAIAAAGRSLSIGYAALGDFKKSEHYFQYALFEDMSRYVTGTVWPTGEVLEQMILHGKNNHALKYLKVSDNLQRCTAAVQLLAFQKQYDVLLEILDKTDCTTSKISSICYHTEPESAFKTFRILYEYYDAKPKNSDEYKIYQFEALHCYYNLKNKYPKNAPLSYDGVVKMLGDANIEIDDKIRKGLIWVLEKQEAFEASRKALSKINDIAIKNEVATQVIRSLVRQNDIAALQEYKNYLSNIKRADVLKEWRVEKSNPASQSHHAIYTGTKPFSVFLLDKKLEPISMDGAVKDSILRSTEVMLLLLNEISDPEVRLHLLYRFLSHIILRDEKDKTEFVHLIDKCKNQTYSQCVFSDIQSAYNSSKGLLGMFFENPKTEKVYLKANALMSKYDYLKSLNKTNTINSLEVSMVIAQHNKNCAEYLGRYIKDTITGKDISHKKKDVAIECLVTSSAYKKYLKEDNSQIKSEIIEKLVKKLYFKPQLAFEYLQSATYNVPQDDAHKLITRVLGVLKSSKENAPHLNPEFILDYIQSFLETGNDYKMMSQLYRVYIELGYTDKAKSMLERNIAFKEMHHNVIEEREYKRKSRDYVKAFSKKSLTDRVRWLSSEIYDQTQFNKPYKAAYPSQKKMLE